MSPPSGPHRILVAGTSGSGKTWLARQIADLIKARHVELDSLFHGPGWTRLPTFEAEVEKFSAEPSWVTEWQYGSARDLLASRADLVVWLDLSRTRIMSQVIPRTLTRRLRRQKLWNGNVEPPLRTFFTDPEHIVRWAWTQQAVYATRIADLRTRRPDLPIVRLRNRREIRRWLSRLTP